MDLDRPIFGRYRLEHCLHLALVATALVLRLLWLGERPLHHDESIHAYYSWRILTTGVSDYRYDPTYHGPTLYYLTAVFEWLLGPSDASARMIPVVCGVGLAALAWPLRPFLGRHEALAYAALVTLSPTLGYYSRSLRHDLPMAFFTLAALVSFLHFINARRRLAAYAAGLLIGFAAATKEDIYLTAIAFASVLAIVGLWGSEGGATLRERAWSWLGALWGFLRSTWVPLATSVVIALTVYLIFYTSLLTHPENWNATGRALRYWWGQHEIKRIGGPRWYYVPLEIVYEPLIFFPAVLVLVRWLRGGATRVQATFGAWALANFALYAWAQEKVPWLLVPVLVPQAVVAAHFFAGRSAAQLVRWLPLVGFTVWSFVSSNFLHDAPRTSEPPDQAHSEPMVYVQSTYDVPRILAEIESVSRKLGTGQKTPMVVVGEATWPLSWYLRGYPVHWGSLPAETNAPILVMDPKDAGRLEKDLGERYTQQKFSVRGWWQIDWSLATLANVARFLVYRLSWNPPGTTDAVLFVARDLSRGRSLDKVRLTPAPPVKSYASAPHPAAPALSFGGPGSEPGELREPRGLAVDRDGTLLVADSFNNRIQRLDLTGTPLAVWGGPAPGDGPRQFRTPCGVAASPDGSIYVADTWNHRIQKLSPSGEFLLEWREENPGFWGPRAVAVAPDGSIFVVDTGNKRILSYDPGGARLSVFGSEGSDDGQFIEPVGLAIDPEEKRLYVADTGNHRVQVFGLDGQFRGKWTVFGWQEFYTEPYLAWRDGLLWATDSFNHRLNAYDPSGRLRHSTGGSESTLGRPIGVVVSTEGRLFVSDAASHRIAVFDPSSSEDVRP